MRESLRESDVYNNGTIRAVHPLKWSLPREHRASLDGRRDQKADSPVLHGADDLTGQAFHQLGRVSEQVELDKVGSRLGDLAQSRNAS